MESFTLLEVKLSPALLALEDGSLFEGMAFGYLNKQAIAVGEVVFNTAITGYQEILTDPSYADQLITLTYPHIGNVGVNNEDQESEKIYAKGLIVRQYSPMVSNWRQQGTLEQFLIRHQVVGITEIDTRRLTRLIREKGALKGCIFAAATIGEAQKKEAIWHAQQFSGLAGLDLAKEVSCIKPYQWQGEAPWERPTWQVVVYDFGVKKTILRCLQDLGCMITVVPAQTTAEQILALNPEGIVLSNGPGDPQACHYAIKAIQKLLTCHIPMLGICLGHQLLALACGATTQKMKLGHHGANHPVRDARTERILITSQNHGFSVSEENLPDCLEVTHRSLFDNTIQGFRYRGKPIFSFQGHPESGPGPHDARILFTPFIQAMQKARSLQERQCLKEPISTVS